MPSPSSPASAASAPPTRDLFILPPGTLYFDGNSLGPVSHAARASVLAALDSWEQLAISGWTGGDRPWLSLAGRAAELMAPLVGAAPERLCLTGSTTSNLHQILATFFRPAGRRRKLLIDALAFPTDRYAAQSQLAWRGLDPRADLVAVQSADGYTLDESTIEAALTEDIALAILPAVLFTSGQLLDLERLAATARARGVLLAVDASHSAGSVPHAFDAWGIDFAFWCTYKYLNGGPGAVGALYVNARHATAVPALAGWFGATPEALFSYSETLSYAPDAARFQTGTPHILSLAPLLGSLEIFAQAGGIQALRQESLRLTRHLRQKLEDELGLAFATPREDKRRGGHLALRHPEARRICQALKAAGVLPDFRAPDVIRLTPAALYTSLADCDAVADRLARIMNERAYERFPAEDGPVP